jgi:hemolysin type calcium-binding protein/uncharacterized protein DUF11
VTLGVIPRPARAGQTFAYVATVTNAGAGAGTPSLRFSLPAGVKFVSGAVDGQPGCSVSGRIVTCRLGSVPPGSLSLARVRVTARSAGRLVCLVTAASNPPDSAVGDNSASLVLRLRPAAARPPAGTSSGKTFRGTAKSDRLVGTPGDDVIRGLAGADLLDGRAGRDRIFGDAGNDVLTGGPGADAILAGPGKDVVRVAGGDRDSVACGTGRDTVFADQVDVIARDCEVVHRTAAAP